MLQCPVTLHLIEPCASEQLGEVVEALRHEHLAMAYAAPSPAAVAAAEFVAGSVEVDVRVEAALEGLDVDGFGRGARPESHCTEALESIADLHRGEHVLIVGDGLPGPGLAVVRQLEIGDDGWGPLT